MHASDGRKWLEGSLPDPEARRYCFIFDAIAAIGSLAFPEALAGLFGAGEAAGAGAAAGGAALTEAELGSALGFGLGEGGAAGAGAAIPGALTLGPELATGAAGAAEAGTGLLDLGFGGAVPGGEALTTGATGAAGGLPSPLTIEPLASTAVPATPGAAAPGALAGTVPVPAGIPGQGAATGLLTDPAAYIAATPEAQVGADIAGTSPAAERAAEATSFLNTPGAAAATGTGSIIPQGVKDAFQVGGPLVAGGGLLYNLMNRNQPIPGEKPLNQAASSLTATAGAQANKGLGLESFINSGTLPPGLSEGLKTATAAAEASIKSTHARSGTTGSSAEAQDIQAAHDRAQNAAAQMALQLLQQGSSMVGQAVNTEALAAGLYREIMANALTQDDALGKAIGNFSSALAGAGGTGGGSTVTLRAA